MDTRHLIDGIVRQTTILIAQLSTAAGIRAPLAKVADQVFLDLTQEIEAQGVRRKVVADMFGMALRTYQKKINRLTESADTRERTLWESILLYLQERECISRKQIQERFSRDDSQDVAAVLKDLASSGFIWATGRGEEALYRPSKDSDFKELQNQQRLEAVTNLVWLSIYNHRTISAGDLILVCPFAPELTQKAIDALIGDGRVNRTNRSGVQMLSCTKLTIPIGAEKGWETAVFDHFTAVTTAIASKLKANATRAHADDVVGGSTMTFRVYEKHPYEKEVYGLLKKIRNQVNRLWDDVSEYNETHPLDAEKQTDVTFYFGQSVLERPDVSPDREGSEE